MTVSIAVVSDLHAGSTWGLCPPVVDLYEEGRYEASKYQMWLWENWINYWQWARENARGKRYMVINGDAVDGVHHRTTQLISTNLADHISIADECIKAAVDVFQPRRILFVRGTEVHVGSAGREEELLATRYKKYVPHDRPYSRYTAWVEAEGVKFHFAHHVGGWGRPWTAVGAPGRESVMMRDWAVTSHLRTGEPLALPDVSVRSHQHRFNDSGLATYPRVFVTPSWQLSTAFGRRISQSRLPDVGGMLFIARAGEYTAQVKIYHIEGEDDARVVFG